MNRTVNHTPAPIGGPSFRHKLGKALRGYGCTLKASYLGYVCQAVVNNFAPLLFLTFRDTYGISLEKIALLVSLNFGVQLMVDLISTKLVDRIGYRISIVAGHIFAAVGLAGLSILPDVMPGNFSGLALCVCLYAVGGGVIEVLISPIVEACPTDKKEASMSLLHSFYCWGSVGVILLSTLFFVTAGISNWRMLALCWAVVPAVNAFLFSKVPIRILVEEGEGMGVKGLARSGAFWLFVFILTCAGASEQAMSQWASAFAESGLQVSKSIGDLAGPCMFSILMGLSRVFYAKFSERIPLTAFMAGSALLCVFSYILASFSSHPWAALAGCAVCGLSVGIMWPGAFSLALKSCPKGGTAMFALLALAGDVGCSLGPSIVGIVSDRAGGNIRAGLSAAVWLPLLLLTGLLGSMYMNRRKRYKQ